LISLGLPELLALRVELAEGLSADISRSLRHTQAPHRTVARRLLVRPRACRELLGALRAHLLLCEEADGATALLDTVAVEQLAPRRTRRRKRFG
tara:strand:- start:813 stop:1094 length:282 start_codon:yes stop_codon:yes gene_type:complete